MFACHNFLDYSGEARNSSVTINIEETMAILTRYVNQEKSLWETSRFYVLAPKTVSRLYFWSMHLDYIGLLPSCIQSTN